MSLKALEVTPTVADEKSCCWVAERIAPYQVHTPRLIGEITQIAGIVAVIVSVEKHLTVKQRPAREMDGRHLIQFGEDKDSCEQKLAKVECRPYYAHSETARLHRRIGA